MDITTAGITAGNLRRQDITSSAIYPQAGQVFQHLNIGRARGRGFPSLRPRSLELQLRLTNLAGPDLAPDVMSWGRGAPALGEISMNYMRTAILLAGLTGLFMAVG